MANRRRKLEPGDPLTEFAAKLRELQAGAIARARTPQEVEALKIDKVAANKEWRCGASTIYAALSGARLPSIQTLRAMVEAWDPRGSNGFPAWWKERDATQDKIISRRVADQDANASSLRRSPPDGRQIADPAALAALRHHLAIALASQGLNRTQLAQRSALGRTTVSVALSPAGPAPSEGTIGALCRALHLDPSPMLYLLRQARYGPDEAGEVYV
ncbi:helix-turn-helix domain-containing protein [Streptomyces sp. NPDC001621]|uniref:helix-turn-helix domain-containing protein n=1 Tax=Streptomyces sp. NPDC001621 TaxID=3364594 RepID=UPI00368FF65E